MTPSYPGLKPFDASSRQRFRHPVSRADFERLAEQLAGIQGRFLLSINDRPKARAVFVGFAIEAVTTSYTIARDKQAGDRAGELLISNRPALAA